MNASCECVLAGASVTEIDRAVNLALRDVLLERRCCRCLVLERAVEVRANRGDAYCVLWQANQEGLL